MPKPTPARSMLTLALAHSVPSRSRCHQVLRTSDSGLTKVGSTMCSLGSTCQATATTARPMTDRNARREPWASRLGSAGATVTAPPPGWRGSRGSRAAGPAAVVAVSGNFPHPLGDLVPQQLPHELAVAAEFGV